ncbi:MAG: TolC family outer membrane protein [Pseudomonadota bacterium]|nr:TolC family outer membrane protein [Pseudomonadota bacterium]MDP1905884.1 TolC family outer membrane protein [Pseudomonadota bacterium]MDP2351756.1 TolC family outer membrane protein [Pseudomonadota bacterium]
MRLTLLTAALACVAQVAWGANLSEVYQLAHANDATFAAAQQAYKAGLEKLPQGRALLRPTINLSANLNHIDTQSSIPGFSKASDPYGFSLSLSQPLYRKQNLESYEQAKLQVLQAEQTLKVAEQELQLRVAQAYFDVLQAQDVLATARAQKQAYAEQLAQARKSFEVGAATITDTHEAQARYDLTTAQEIAGLNDLEVKKRALEKIINQDAPQLALLDEQARMLLPQPDNMDAWVKQAGADSLAVALGRTAQEAARREVDKQKGGHMPTLDLKASYSDNRGQASAGFSNVETQTGTIGLEFVLPIYQGGGTSSRVREASANLEKARHELDNARRQASLDARQAYLGVISGNAQVQALKQALVSSEAQLRSTKLGLEVGVRTRVDVLNAQQQVYTTRKDLAAARYQTLLAGLTLKAAAGSLAETDLKALDALLREEKK